MDGIQRQISVELKVGFCLKELYLSFAKTANKLIQKTINTKSKQVMRSH